MNSILQQIWLFLQQHLKTKTHTMPILLSSILTIITLFGMIRFAWKKHIQSHLSLKSLGNWAAITGCTSGIGKALVMELAQQNFNLLLISRTEAKLRQLQQEITQKFPTYNGTIKYFVHELEDSSPDKYEKLHALLQTINLGIFINNAGIGYSHPMFIQELSDEEIFNLVNVNFASAIRLTKIAVDVMAPKRRGLIVFTGSGMSELPPIPLHSLYRATKSALVSFAESLQKEAEIYNIAVQCHVPLFVESKLSKVRRNNFDIPSSEKYAKHAISTMRQASLTKNPIVSPYWVHALLIQIIYWVPKSLWNYLVMNRERKVREKAIRKKGQTAEFN